MAILFCGCLLISLFFFFFDFFKNRRKIVWKKVEPNWVRGRNISRFRGGSSSCSKPVFSFEEVVVVNMQVKYNGVAAAS